MQKTAKITCTGCKQDFELPSHMAQDISSDTAVICPVCVRLGLKGVDIDDLPEQRKLREKEIAVDRLKDQVTDLHAQLAFHEFWGDQKQELKSLSKRELAEQCFSEGSYAFIDFFVFHQKDDNQRIKMLEITKGIMEEYCEKKQRG